MDETEFNIQTADKRLTKRLKFSNGVEAKFSVVIKHRENFTII